VGAGGEEQEQEEQEQEQEEQEEQQEQQQPEKKEKAIMSLVRTRACTARGYACVPETPHSNPTSETLFFLFFCRLTARGALQALLKRLGFRVQGLRILFIGIRTRGLGFRAGAHLVVERAVALVFLLGFRV